VRLGRISAALLGAPYLAHPLIGSPTTPEQLVTRVDAFDCVTLVESVLALGRAQSPARFADELIALRYHRGRIDWHERNHYTSEWIDRNQAAARLDRVLPELWIGEDRRLSVLEGYRVVERRVCFLPVERAGALAGAARTGDVVAFVSPRDDLDCFHVGLLVVDGEVRLRHASRSLGSVVEVPLAEFLARNATPGLLVARPLEDR